MRREESDLNLNVDRDPAFAAVATLATSALPVGTAPGVDSDAMREAHFALDLAACSDDAVQAGIAPGELLGLTTADARALRQQVCALLDREEFTQAVPLAVRLLTLFPDQARHGVLAGTALQRSGLYREAVIAYSAAVALQETPLSLYRLGECFHAMGKSGAARDCFQRSLVVCSTDPLHDTVRGLAVDALNALTDVTLA